jgi:AraC-like DNA-binding protein
VPDGCSDLIWDGTRLTVVGPDTGPHFALAVPGVVLSALRFGPGVGPAVFGVAADELRDQRIDYGALVPAAELRRAADQLASARDPVATLEAIVGRRMRTPSALMQGVARLLAVGHPVHAVADRVGLSARQLQRRAPAAFGYGPKLLARILRFGRAAELARCGLPFATVAATAGYSDQAHLAREVKRLSGVTLTELID